VFVCDLCCFCKTERQQHVVPGGKQKAAKAGIRTTTGQVRDKIHYECSCLLLTCVSLKERAKTWQKGTK
jgi:hypothetical protein